jgi:hypothetical protein
MVAGTLSDLAKSSVAELRTACLAQSHRASETAHEHLKRLPNSPLKAIPAAFLNQPPLNHTDSAVSVPPCETGSSQLALRTSPLAVPTDYIVFANIGANNCSNRTPSASP